jgi:hypothetical protein
VVGCKQLEWVAKNANTIPSVITTTGTKGQLVEGHEYNILEFKSSDSPSISLRNPWGRVNSDSSGRSVTGDPNITDLKDGNLRLPISVTLDQCTSIVYRA